MAALQAPLVDRDYSPYLEVAQHREHVDGNVFAIHCLGYVGKADEGGNIATVGECLLKYRSTRIFDYIVGSERYAVGDIHGALRFAFNRMDNELAKMVEESGWDVITGKAMNERLLWCTGHNTTVVIVDGKHGRVHLAGASDARVLLARQDKEVVLTDDFGLYTDMRHWVVLWGDVECVPDLEGRDSTLYFYKEVKLNRGDEYLFVVSNTLFRYIDKKKGTFLQVFLSRQAQVGLEEACRSMLGLYPDKPKSIIAIPLDVGDNKRIRVDFKDDTGMVDDPESEEEECSSDEEDDDMKQIILQPWKNGEPRPPDPKTFRMILHPSYYLPKIYRGITSDPNHWVQRCS